MSLEPLRFSFRRQVRERGLQVVRELALEHGWDRVRMAEVATMIGVSRPTLYKEFGDKQGLGEALVLDETGQFLLGITDVMDHHRDDLAEAIAAAVLYTLQRADNSPILRAVLTSARGSQDLLPALTTRSAPILVSASSTLTAWLTQYFPHLDHDDVTAGIDALVRLTVSHIVLPAGGHEETAQRLAQVTLRYLRLEVTPGCP